MAKSAKLDTVCGDWSHGNAQNRTFEKIPAQRSFPVAKSGAAAATVKG